MSRKSIAEVRELLGDEAAQLTDEQVGEIRECLERHAAAICETYRDVLKQRRDARLAGTA